MGSRSASKLSRDLDVWQSYVAKVEAGTTKPSTEYIDKFSVRLGIGQFWSKLLHHLNSDDGDSVTPLVLSYIRGLLPTRVLLGPRATIPITMLQDFIFGQPMLVISRQYLDAQIAFFGRDCKFFEKNPEPLCYDAKEFMGSHFTSFLATDYMLLEDCLLVSDFFHFLKFDADIISDFTKAFDKVRTRLFPY